ncbi:MAG: hypothetical protein GWN16_01770, partial [Calditrichae bacterium]|nr:hypothetical protein [Calditrichia bacterium]
MNREVLSNIFGFFVLFIFAFVIGIFIMTELGLDLESAFGSVVATLG